MSPQLFGIIEMALSFGVVLGLLGWQYWSLREKPEDGTRQVTDDKGPPSTGDEP